MTAYEQILVALCCWREARGEGPTGMAGVAWVIRNRAAKPGWWGHTIAEAVTCKNQFSSLTAHGDVQLALWPAETDPRWLQALQIAQEAILGSSPDDPTLGATYYYDATLDNHPPSWATNGQTVHTVEIGRLRFLKEATP